MRKAIQIITCIVIGILCVSFLESKAQSGTMRSPNGFLVFFSSGPLNFTIRLDNPNSETPVWVRNNYLQLLEDQFNIQVIERESICSKTTQQKDYLSVFQKWETKYIDSTMSSSVKRSAFLNDNKIIGTKGKDFQYNAWYYTVALEEGKLCFYYFDFYKNDHFIRMTYIGSLENARLFIPAVLDGFQFYNKQIDVKKLQYSLKNGLYSYPE